MSWSSRFMYKLYRHKLYQHNLYRHKLYRHKLYREQIVLGTNCIRNILYREKIVSGTNCIGNKLYRVQFELPPFLVSCPPSSLGNGRVSHLILVNSQPLTHTCRLTTFPSGRGGDEYDHPSHAPNMGRGGQRSTTTLCPT